jgi:predicted nucleic acid-binding Zn finger protein
MENAEDDTPLYYNIWITVLTASYTDQIVTSLVKKGYTVSSAASNGVVALGKKSNPCHVIGLRVMAPSKSYTSIDIQKDVSDVLTIIKVYYYSLIISFSTDCCWLGSNIELDYHLVNEDSKTINKPN